MRNFLWMLLLLLSVGCSKKKSGALGEDVDNAATRYADNLITSVERAKVARDKANQSTVEQEQQMKEMQKQVDQ